MRPACALVVRRYSAHVMKFWRALLSILLLSILCGGSGCANKGGGETGGTAGDYVTGTPLPERREGTSFFGGNVERGQFQPVYFDFDSQDRKSTRLNSSH